MSKQKNTNNKAKHTKLMDKKKNKIRKEKELRAAKMKELVAKMNASKQENKE